MATAGMQISKSDVQTLANRYKAAATKVAQYKHQADTLARTAIHGIEAGGTAFLCGLGDSYFRKDGDPGAEVMGVPLPLIVAGGSLGLSFMLDDDLSEHLRSVSLGATCAYAANMGYAAGERLRIKKLAAAGANAGNLANQVPAPTP